MAGALPLLHSLPTSPYAGCVAVPGRPACDRLRPYVLGYAGFRAAVDGRLRRRMLPLDLTTLIVDFGGRGSWVTGARGVHSVHEQAEWRHGVAIGLTPVGVSALWGVPAAKLVGATVDPAAVLGPRAAELADRLGSASDWAARFALLDALLAAWLPERNRPPQEVVTRAWWRLHRPGRTVGEVAAGLGISRRGLELGFRRHIGMSPKTVARVARLQYAVHRLGRPGVGLSQAVECGYADQSHLTREMRALAGLTPAALFAFLQDLRTPPA
ncbi:helix-turn-helix transcriptional regulator [Micromonospora fiedleri]|uniref:Helix-turn-helix transcriptional regulator n=1 Tax=Micromonospora fiedleri TaxID=1157498 RepID=A0ABS1UJI2_9ACTN|nr:helix-turn-helix transcriptional regulator [Micromonospora fiedleri]MBL6276389.1 helix-turn-helix transcriptional regulator [Micromonospora fiedleri]